MRLCLRTGEHINSACKKSVSSDRASKIQALE
jgi:hypothetical protein